MNTNQNEGRIELILGPMFSGKSTRLIETIRKYTYKAKKTIMIKYYADQRYSEKDMQRVIKVIKTFMED